MTSEYEQDQGEPTFDEDDLAYFRTLAKAEGCIPVAMFTVVQWIDPQTGKLQWRKWCPADAPVSQVVGLVQMGVLQMLSECDTGISWVRESDD